MTQHPDSFQRAVEQLGVRRLLRLEDERVLIACLVREQDWRPLHADWWRGKEVSIIGADLGGNFFLRHPDGSVRYWRHATGTESRVAPSVRAFAELIEHE